MARGGKRGNPYRDANGRFASASTGRAGLGASRAKSSPAAARKAAKSQSSRASTLSARSSLKRSRAKLAGRDPADQRLSSALSNRAQKGAVTRGNKALGTAKTLARARLQSASAAGTISKKRPKPATATATARPIAQPAARVPAAQRPGSMTNILGGTLRALAQADAQRIREIESITGQKVRAPKRPTKSVATVRKPGARSVSGTLGDNLRQLAQSDARFMRGMAEIAKDATLKVLGGDAKNRRKAVEAASSRAKPIKSAKTALAKPATIENGTSKTLKLRSRTDGDAFVDRMKRASKIPIRRAINESDRENTLTGDRRRTVSSAKRFEESNLRQARADRTAAAAQAFYRAFGSPSTFGNRQRQSTASSPLFGSKIRKRKTRK